MHLIILFTFIRDDADATAELNQFVLSRVLEQISPQRISPTLVRVAAFEFLIHLFIEVYLHIPSIRPRQFVLRWTFWQPRFRWRTRAGSRGSGRVRVLAVSYQLWVGEEGA